MSESAGWGVPDWLPARVQRNFYLESQREAKEDRQAEARREARREQRADKARVLARSEAEMRGEAVSALAMATGEGLGRTVGDVLADARAMAERADARAAAKDRKEPREVVWGDPVIHGARRSAWPSSEYELDRTLRLADELHRDMVAYQARIGGAAAVEAERAKSSRADVPLSDDGDYFDSPSAASRGYNAYDAGELTRGVENAIGDVW